MIQCPSPESYGHGLATGDGSMSSSMSATTERLRQTSTKDTAMDPNARQPKSRRTRQPGASTLMCALLASSLPHTMAQSCISLSGSTMCPSFNESSVSTNSAVTALFPFLSGVSDTASFDSGLKAYMVRDWTQMKYQQLLGCSSVDMSNTTDLYARYTTSVLCNSIVQNSVKPCGLSGDAARPLCADSCAAYAQSEQEIAASNICGTAGSNAVNQIRADFTNCALPADSLSGSCIAAEQNEPDNCGFSSNIGALCSYCAASSPNSTDSCCVFSGSESRCKGVTLPIVATSALLNVITITQTSTPTGSGLATSSSAATTASNAHHGLTGGQIAGIVVGSILGALLFLGLILAGCFFLSRRRGGRGISRGSDYLNQPVVSRHGRQPEMGFNDGAREEEHASPSIGRVTRMSALEGGDAFSKTRSGYSPVGVYEGSHQHNEYMSDPHLLGLSPPPKRTGSLTSSSHLNSLGAGAERLSTSPSTHAGEFVSPESHHSEQLAFFKDYYSQDEIHPGDLVSTLWAYEPRAADEFHLERGDMIKVLGIWDDGWATGVRVRSKAGEWRQSGKSQRDSGMSQRTSSSPGTSDGDVKAFPLVCVCLPQHWRKTIEGDSTEGAEPPRF
ncbi:Hypothetical protein R9X50_00736800 [Acrodontium crateriforme]|uniref:SH3 domain-containing protein n=1 Tax=Acrodontium crateriforme TaxID=150365 RepID=A0AAQ3MBD9_9PEZI|nr:Hypothetical protein R9X50_00736800 [Acrodontium crateriforme]